jgi:hypothetical protein
MTLPTDEQAIVQAILDDVQAQLERVSPAQRPRLALFAIYEVLGALLSEDPKVGYIDGLDTEPHHALPTERPPRAQQSRNQGGRLVCPPCSAELEKFCHPKPEEVLLPGEFCMYCGCIWKPGEEKRQ